MGEQKGDRNQSREEKKEYCILGDVGSDHKNRELSKQYINQSMGETWARRFIYLSPSHSQVE
jgi:hypothetical protein